MSLVGAMTPMCGAREAPFRCHHFFGAAGGGALAAMPSPAGPTVPKTAKPVSAAIFWTAGSSHTTVTFLPILAA